MRWDANMQYRAGTPEYHRDAAERFRLLADIELLIVLRRDFRRLAAEHEELASGLIQAATRST
jgi:hypothetical protein